MKTKKLLILWIPVVIAGSLVGCGSTNSGPGPIGPVGPQSSVGPQQMDGIPDDAILIESRGKLVSEEYNFRGFDEIEVNALMRVEIFQGDNFRIFTEVEEDAVPYLQVSLEGKRLKLGLDPSQAYNTGTVTLRAEITLPQLSVLIVDGISHVNLKDIYCTHAMDIEVKGLSLLEGQINGCDLKLTEINLSKTTLEGSLQEVIVTAADLSEVDLSSLEMQCLEYEVDDSSVLLLNEN